MSNTTTQPTAPTSRSACGTPVQQDLGTNRPYDRDDYFRVDRWYNDIRAETFPTELLDINLDEGRVIAKAYQNTRFVNQVLEWANTPEELKQAEESAAKVRILKPAEKLILDNLVARVDVLVKKCPHGACVKFSTRSPKDAVLKSDALQRYLQQALSTREALLTSGMDWKQLAVLAFIRGASLSLRVSSGAEAMKYATGSQRVHADISNMELQHSDNPFNLQVAIRAWDTRVEPEWEFRMFVYNHVPTAATQYSRLVYVPELAAQREKVSRALLDYHNRVKHLIPLPNYTLDISTDSKLSHFVIVELNHLPPIAGTSLFNWDDPTDRNIVENGPFTLRVNTALSPTAFQEICALEPKVAKTLKEMRALSSQTRKRRKHMQRFACIALVSAILLGLVLSWWFK
ncbi:hypothetical protein Pelo_8392 [Pelomyxa schiedti]|nr:hypothetical protein Pelo_8392 [Pelomyxa schiedti]